MARDPLEVDGVALGKRVELGHTVLDSAGARGSAVESQECRLAIRVKNDDLAPGIPGDQLRGAVADGKSLVLENAGRVASVFGELRNWRAFRPEEAPKPDLPLKSDPSSV